MGDQAERGPLTQDERNALDHSLADSGCHGFLGDHPELYAVVEQIIAEHLTARMTLLSQKVEAWIRHGEAVPADVTDYDRSIVHIELRALVEEVRRG